MKVDQILKKHTGGRCYALSGAPFHPFTERPEATAMHIFYTNPEFLIIFRIKSAESMIRQPTIFFLEIQLAQAHIPVWRIVEVQHNMTLHELHVCIQVAMGWEMQHLYEFEIDDQRYGILHNEPFTVVEDGDVDVLDSKCFKLRELGLKIGDIFTYLYDFGDSWLHEISVKAYTGLAQDRFDQLPVCRAGAMACPPEDIGGVPAYNALVQFRLHRTPIHLNPEMQKIFKDFDPYQVRIESPFFFAKKVRGWVKYK